MWSIPSAVFIRGSDSNIAIWESTPPSFKQQKAKHGSFHWRGLWLESTTRSHCLQPVTFWEEQQWQLEAAETSAYLSKRQQMAYYGDDFP